MFFELIARNSKRNRKENTLFFSALLIAIIAFYNILSLSGQDVMVFLKEMESDAVNRLLGIVPVFYVMTLVILFFLIYFASRYQLARRNHEFGMYLMLGMTRKRLFFVLLAEDVQSSIIALLIGLPTAVLLSELISLITARMAGLGIIGHRFTLSVTAVFLTAAGFFLIKLTAYLILSIKISRREIGELLSDEQKEAEKQLPAPVYGAALAAGVLFLCAAYYLAVSGTAWQRLSAMGITAVLGITGTFVFFFGMRLFFSLIIKADKTDRHLHVFNVRQLQENVIRQSRAMAVSSLLILAALCCFGAGIGMTAHYAGSGAHVLDYTFEPEYTEEENQEQGADEVIAALKEKNLDDEFSRLFRMKIGSVNTADNYENTFELNQVMENIEKLPDSAGRGTLLNNLMYAGDPHLIALSGYNELLRSAGKEELELGANEAAVYMDETFVTDECTDILNRILTDNPETYIDGDPLWLSGNVQTTAVVTDQLITLSFALILPDEAFGHYTEGKYDVYINGILKKSDTETAGLMQSILRLNEKLDGTGISYESYLQNMGRQLFYIVAAGYLTIYLALIFIITANTVIGIQFLMNQQKTRRRYKTLIRLGAEYEDLCSSSGKQIHWYFGIPVFTAVFSSLFAVKALFSGILSSAAQGEVSEMLAVSAAMILVLCVVEYIYITVVKRMSRRYLLTLMEPEREE